MPRPRVTPDHVEGVPDAIFYEEARDLERDIRLRFRDRPVRYRLLLVRRVIHTIEERLFRQRPHLPHVEEPGVRKIREPTPLRTLTTRTPRG